LATRLVNFVFRQKLKCVVKDIPSGISIAGPEATEAEILQTASTRLTFDYQFVDNPGYNADRGLANIFAARAHWRF
jgi:hypothetical protein